MTTRGEFDVFELRRYEIAEGERERFAQYFDAYFPDVFRQLGAPIFGTFLPMNGEARFIWVRGFADYESRPAILSEFIAARSGVNTPRQ